MKKYLFCILTLFLAVVAIAQERTVTTDFGKGDNYVYHASTTGADTLVVTNQDTIDFVFTNKNAGAIERLSFTASVDTIAGSDSIYYYLYGYDNLDGSVTEITTGGLCVTKSDQIIEISKWFYTNDTTWIDLNYAHYRLRFIQDDNASYDGGANFDYLTGRLTFK